MSIEPEALPEEEAPEPVAHVRIVYLGAVAPHWDIQAVFGDQAGIDEFRQRAMARLQLLPPHDPQFRRNRERVNRDAERELFICEWDLGYDEEQEAASLSDKPEPVAEPVAAAQEPAVVETPEQPEGETPETPGA